MIPEEASPAVDAAQPIDRAELHRWARSELRQGRRAVRLHRRLERRYRKAVLKARGPQQQERVDHRLGEMSVEELARGSGVSAAALRQGGVATAADVLRRTVNDLDDIRNIGPQSALKIMELATDYEQIRPDDLRPPANPDAWTGADYALVRRLAMLATVTGLAPHAAVLREVLASVGWLARTTSWLAWLFSTSSRKTRIQSRAPEIRQGWLSSQTVESLQKLLAGLDRAQQVETEPDSAIAGRWRASSSSLLSSLEQLLSRKGTSRERDFLRRGLATRFSSDLLKRIQAITLNTTRLVLQLRPYQEFGAKFAVAACRGLLGFRKSGGHLPVLRVGDSTA